jgi:hypothetical protein
MDYAAHFVRDPAICEGEKLDENLPDMQPQARR